MKAKKVRGKMGYNKVPERIDFSTEFDKCVIAICPDAHIDYGL